MPCASEGFWSSARACCTRSTPKQRRGAGAVLHGAGKPAFREGGGCWPSSATSWASSSPSGNRAPNPKPPARSPGPEQFLSSGCPAEDEASREAAAAPASQATWHKHSSRAQDPERLACWQQVFDCLMTLMEASVSQGALCPCEPLPSLPLHGLNIGCLLVRCVAAA